MSSPARPTISAPTFSWKWRTRIRWSRKSRFAIWCDKGIDVLVIVPNDADRLSAVVTEVKAEGYPVLSYDRLVRRAGVDLYISFDNEKVGSLIAESLVRAVPPGEFVIINGARNDYNAIMLNSGMHKVLDPYVTARKIRITSERWPSFWDSDEARTDMEGAVAKTGA